ncbi:MAG: UbiA prenyltransferase family protein, partial [Anaerolineales bacterium]|nr:UbiA prenyltransferase family protein [Anaerolineales bacterium]
MLKALFKTMRPRQWTKNVFIFAALVFDKQLFVVDSFLRTLAGFVLFCLISSSVYIFNDLADVEADRQHPEKKNRPIASGKLSVHTAWAAGIVLVIFTLVFAYLLAPLFALIVGAYFVLNLAYSMALKHISILDV